MRAAAVKQPWPTGNPPRARPTAAAAKREWTLGPGHTDNVLEITSISPARVVVNQCQRVALGVTVASTAPFTYQWKRNGLSIAGGNGFALGGPTRDSTIAPPWRNVQRPMTSVPPPGR